MQRIYSAKLLFESTSSPSNIPDKIFEERIVLVKAKNQLQVKEIVKQGFPEETYDNAEGGQTNIKLAAILDIFELVDHLEQKSLHLSEVYSRHLIFDEETSVQEAIEAYSLDK
ncbi:DUF4288 domain-containing protein [Bacillus safensis]|uniref:DUF4288 domain-containing protein n=1 Tax=Bacillus TaxID=1386 RepID=UPI0007DBFA7E|nr:MULTISPECIES: DUF4288 domain-containing protein [Bacillus]MBW4854007.1 DUF4288 domain-containing protein [Bacillaceae bacterium]MBW4857960.1 DUF4288 domain-containing protein [Bacillaceae bacterium]MCY7582709.1 DUF4288 domain-containing protein [Bacillus safensis]MCY7586320.1 DUF4288 domain-containing protein [Bacillus safensis]MCY7609848.1 DUF4288 domain-containing protein [Bacillus safensis]